MFQSAISPIRDMRGDFTVNIVSTPYFPMSPALTVESRPQTQLCVRLFEDSSEWTTDSSSNDWTTDSEADTVKSEEQEPENEFRWSATP
jgi:hypothetical protein